MTKTLIFRVLAVLVFAAMFAACQQNDLSSANDWSNLEVNNYVQIATGQSKLYDNDGAELTGLSRGDALFGQDANYKKGATMNFLDNGDSIIVDLNTGLMWQKIPISQDFSWADAADYCNNLVLGGYNDWRLPSCKELYSISNFEAGWPYIDTSYFKLVNNTVMTKDEQYWTSNLYVGVTAEGGENAAFGVNHVTGHIKAYAAVANMSGTSGAPTTTGTPPTGSGAGAPLGNPFAKYVRAVRGNNYGVNEFVDNSDGTISDKATGLMWAQDDDSQAMNWEDALAYAENSDLAGYSDWRLPNVKELQGIVDYSRSPSATVAANVGPAINSIFVCTPIVNEAGNDDYGYYWTSTSAHFTSGEPYYYAWYVAFGMAVDGNGNDFHGAGGVRFDTKYEGGPLGEGGERFYNYVRLVRNVEEK